MLQVSFVSAIIVLGHPAEMYVHGTQLVIRVLGYVVGIMLSTIIFVPLLYPLKLKTVFEVSILVYLIDMKSIS